jgi:NAD(P)-dependent dehydrogenase (short-subunit alcohol dehydrogenase family)
MHALVQGASRGIGLAMATALAARHEMETVFASARRPAESDGLASLRDRHGDRVQLVSLDVADEASIAAAARHIRERVSELHLLVNVAGLLHEPGVAPEKRLEQVDDAALARLFAVNAAGPLLVVKHLAPLLMHERRAVVANLSARVGSIGDNRLGGWYGYRASKAAQNMLTKTLAIELGRRAPNVICVALHPGTVDTALSLPFQRGVPEGRLFSPDRAARQLLAIIDSLEPEDSGRFLAWDRTTIPW